jgi:hypothetical protein
MALMLVQGSLFPLILLIPGVCSLSFSIQQACLAYGLYKGVCSLCLLFSKLVLLLNWSRDFILFSLYCWSPAHFWSIIFLHFLKKKLRAGCSGAGFMCCSAWFFSLRAASKAINHSIIALVPKSAHVSNTSDFRPISCCNVVYKIISKIPADRMGHALAGITSPMQNAFLGGHRMADNINLL